MTTATLPSGVDGLVASSSLSSLPSSANMYILDLINESSATLLY